jgi:flagellar biosynthesis protein FlhF
VADEHLDLSAPAAPVVAPVQMAVPPQVSAPRQTGNWTDPAELTMQAMVGRTPAAPVAAPVVAPVDHAAREALASAQAANASMLGELRAMRAMMKERFETIAFVDKLQPHPCAGQHGSEAAGRRLLAGADPQDARRHACRRQQRPA